MALFSLKSACASVDPKTLADDHRAAGRLGQYKLGKEAIYYPGFPGDECIPFSAVTRALTRNTSLPLTGCCGKALPMVLLRLYWGADSHKDFLFEKPEQANAALDAVAAARPDLTVERETRPLQAI